MPAATAGTASSSVSTAPRSSADSSEKSCAASGNGLPLGGVGQPGQVDPTGADAVLDVVHRVRDVVGPVHHLRLEAAPGAAGTGRPDPVEDRGVVGVDAELAARRAAAATGT